MLDPQLTADVTGPPRPWSRRPIFDPLRDEGDAYAERLRVSGVPVAHRQGPGLSHGYVGFLGLAEAADRQRAAVLDGRTPT